MNAPEPPTFDQIVGQKIAVEGLLKRIRARDHKTGLLLYGPEGTGKRTLARLYAKAILCENPSAEGLPCYECETCGSSDQLQGMSYIEVNAQEGDQADRASQIRDIARGESLFGDRRVFVIANTETYPPVAFDVLLKTLEETPTETTFVLLANDLKGVRVAGQSRCVIYRVRPLEPAQARQYGRELCDRYGIVYDDRVLDVIVAASQRLPGRLQRICAGFDGRGELTLEGVRTALDLDWVNSMIAQWYALLNGKVAALEEFVASAGVEPTEFLRRARVILHDLYLCVLRRTPTTGLVTDPALVHWEEADWTMLVDAFRARARRRGTTDEDLWRSLAQYWLSDDHADRAGLLEAGRATRRIMRGAAP